MPFNKSQISQALTTWVRPETPQAEAIPLEVAAHLSERNRFTDLLPYREVSEDGLIFLDDSEAIGLGFMMQLSPLLGVGTQTEEALEALLGNMPADSALQFFVVSTPQIDHILDTWKAANAEKSTNPVIDQIIKNRADFFKFTSVSASMLPSQKMHPRNLNYYFAARIPFKGDISNDGEFEGFKKLILDTRESVLGVLKSAGIFPSILYKNDVQLVLREILNPHITPDKRVNEMMPEVPMHKDIVDRNTRIRILDKGMIGFNGDEGEAEVVVIPITSDAYPNPLHITRTASLLGSTLSRDDRITAPFVAYTNIQILDSEAAKDKLLTKQGVLAKQTMSDSQWYQSLMGHIFERKQVADALVAESREGRRLTRAYSGINIYTNPSTYHLDLEQVKSIWRRAGFRCSEERFISFPVFLASLPLNYSATMDPPNKGLMRATLMTGLNAASLAHVQGDWYGSGVEKGGPLLISRRGQLATIDLFSSDTNYNGVVIAESGAGKSVFTSTVICDILARGGRVRMIDVGKSYFRLCQLLGGTNMIFDPENPKSLNPMWGIESKKDLDEMMPMLKALIRQMAYPLQEEEATPAWEYAAIEAGVTEAWKEKKGVSGLADVYYWFSRHEDSRARDLALQIEPYAVGRYQQWFNGRRELEFDTDLVVIELEQLKVDPELSAVILSLLIHHTTREMYLSDRSRKFLLGIDEAWDLLSGLKTGKYIETAFRRLRKYNGSALVISQGFADFEKSAAGQAAIENAAWQFLLSQKSESIESAVRHGRLSADSGLVEALKSVKSGPGFSEILVKSASGTGIYRLVLDRHSYYTFTTKADDTTRMDRLMREQGLSVAQAIDALARADYKKMFGTEDLSDVYGYLDSLALA